MFWSLKETFTFDLLKIICHDLYQGVTTHAYDKMKTPSLFPEINKELLGYVGSDEKAVPCQQVLICIM